LLEAHRKRFPSGQLTPERLYLTADALARLGNTTLARKHAQALIRAYPSSAYARQVEGVIERAQR
jgi:TolA-binding protein